jgi:hypothetical protein
MEATPAGTPEEWERWISGLHDLQPKPATYEELRHALCVELGSEEEDEGGFDPTRFERPRGAGEANGEKPVAVQAKKANEPEGEIPVDEEFVRELDALKSEANVNER